MSRIVRRLVAVGSALMLVGAMSVSAFADEINYNSNTQTAVNTATSTQSQAAISGNAVATDDSRARTGHAAAEAISIQEQANIQVAANQVFVGDLSGGFPGNGDLDNTNLNDQVGANQSASDQSGAAVSGEAVADDDSTAASGRAFVGAYSAQAQANIQVSVNQALIDLGGLGLPQ